MKASELKKMLDEVLEDGIDFECEVGRMAYGNVIVFLLNTGERYTRQSPYQEFINYEGKSC